MEDDLYVIRAPQPRAWAQLPDQAGKVRGRLRAVARRDGELWAALSVPVWGRPDDGAGLVELWVPEGVVEFSEADDLSQVRRAIDVLLGRVPLVSC